MTEKPNVLLVTIDSLRADAIYSDEVPTPSHDYLAEEGKVFKRAFSQGPFTTFSMPSLFTSRYPSELQYLEFSDSTVGVYIDEEPTITECLQSAGYQTAGFHSNPLLSNLFGFDRGFDTFESRLPLSETDWLPGRAKILVDKLFRLARTHAYLPAEKLTMRALNWLDEYDRDQPFFCWVHYMDVHGPYQAKDGITYLNKYRGERLWRKAISQPENVTDKEKERIKELYNTEVTYTDKWVGRLVEGLETRELFDDTITIATSDHGELFGNHGKFSHPHLLHDELTHVPLIVRHPERKAAQIEDIVELIDVGPTILEDVGSAVPVAFTGETLPSQNGRTKSNNVAISESDLVPDYHGSVRNNEYRYIRDETSEGEALHHLPSDPTERNNIADENSNIFESLRSRIDRHLADRGRSVGGSQEVTQRNIDDDDVEDRLTDLGYLE